MAKALTKTARARRRTAPDWRPLLLVGVGILIMAAALALALAGRGQDDDAAPPVSAADFVLPGLDGTIALADFRGQVVLVNFWASWCPPCMAEMPDLYAYHRAHRDDGFTLLAINMGEDAATAQRFMDANRFDFPVALDVNGAVYARFGATALPSSFLIDPDGRLIKAWPAGVVTPAMLERDVTPLLQG